MKNKAELSVDREMQAVRAAAEITGKGQHPAAIMTKLDSDASEHQGSLENTRHHGPTIKSTVGGDTTSDFLQSKPNGYGSSFLSTLNSNIQTSPDTQKYNTKPWITNHSKSENDAIGRTGRDTIPENFFAAHSVQPKLSLGKPGDEYEQQADRIADKVVNGHNLAINRKSEGGNTQLLEEGGINMQKEEQIQTKIQLQAEEAEEEPVQAKPIDEHITPIIQRQYEEEEPEEEEPVQAKPIAEQITPIIQRQYEPEDEEEEELIQPKTTGDLSTVGSGLESRLKSSKNSGQTIDMRTSKNMESSFGADFSKVRIHTGADAVQMSNALGAQAFTHGQDIYFNSGKYRPETSDGKRLLAHELVHVGQQKSVGFHYLGNEESMIQTYRSNVHYDLTKNLGGVIRFSRINSGKVSNIINKIADANKDMDAGYTHPTPTSIAPFIVPSAEVISSGLTAIGGLSGWLGRQAQKQIRNYKTMLQQNVPSIDKEAVLHFPKRIDAIGALDFALKGIKNANDEAAIFNFAELFGKALHLFQDSFSHSFPPNAPYNDFKNFKHKTNKETLVAIFLISFGIQKHFPDTTYGKGAVIRHVLLGHYPDDYGINSEQSPRDIEMFNGTLNYFLKLCQSICESPAFRQNTRSVETSRSEGGIQVRYPSQEFLDKSPVPAHLRRIGLSLISANSYNQQEVTELGFYFLRTGKLKLRVMSASLNLKKQWFPMHPQSTIRLGDAVTILETDGAWYRVKPDEGREGWIHSNLLLPKVFRLRSGNTGSGTSRGEGGDAGRG